ncbi:glutaredoxin family protein [Fortiea sp. LEGE XX443]|uniref:glutaredoxin family protein n=1 Tax=Fortiea sp. LEGE XX443 TaxID=1828611 RepID=UPI00187E8DDA|nr:glutaredoxin family protein [Fortiea sp. LEGE XX443]MBE9004166.1 glutaredoxin family protein [Fortiea sp. LEGE XX443]
MRLILYSKPGCHLCEGLQEKLAQILETQNLTVELEIRDITTREDWWLAYEYEVPVLVLAHIQGAEVIEQPLPRPSPRANVQQIQQMLCKYLSNTKKNDAE